MSKTKTFKEVIADIKEGEVWEGEGACGIKSISIIQNSIHLESRGEYPHFLVTSQDYKFTLKEKGVSFEEAFKEYEKGSEIESLVSNDSYKKINGTDNYFDSDDLKWIPLSCVSIEINEIRGEWKVHNRYKR